MRQFLAIWVFCQTLSAGAYQYTLSIGAIFQDEAPYLKEWIEFHKLVGVEHFYLYNNCSQDDFEKVLQPYIDLGEVELFDWPIVATSWNNWIYGVQPAAYTNCIQKATGRTQWLALIDIDEFLTPVCALTIPEILKDYEGFGGVCFNWKIFGHSGFFDVPSNKLLIETLVLTAPFERSTHRAVKSIFRPECVERSEHPHYVVYKEGFFHVNSNQEQDIDADGWTQKPHYERLIVNHYWSRTANYLRKKLTRYAEWFPEIRPERWPEYVDQMNELRDHSMEKFVSPLREKMGWKP